MQDFTLLFMAAGTGSRLGADRPKQFLPLGEETVLTHSLRLAASFAEVKEVVVVANPDYMEETRRQVESLGLTQPTAIVPGGDLRQDSVRLGLAACHCPMILLHEAARPFVRRADFRRMLDYEDNNCTYASPVPFTVLEGAEHIERLLDRNRLWNVQLPQKFEREALTRAHAIAHEKGLVFTDDSGVLFSCLGISSRIVPGSLDNVKVTTAMDYATALQIWPEWIRGDREDEE